MLPRALAATVFTAALVSPAAVNAQPADLLFSGGAIYTATATPAEAVAVRDGEIVYVGSAADAAAYSGPATRHVDIGDGLLAPGFIDAHLHPVNVGLALTLYCNLRGIGERARILQRIADCAASRSGEAWLIGHGWALGAFPDSKPTAAELDAILPSGMAAFLKAEDGHNGWASSDAFQSKSF